MPVMNTDVKSERLLIDCFGCVQGVGFRPTMYRIASRYSLTGVIFNNAIGAHLDLEGNSEHLKLFLHEIQSTDLAPIRIDQLKIQQCELAFHQKLTISESSQTQDTQLYSIPPDSVTCKVCWEDFFNSNHRLYQYPFISCTQCGPRWSIINELPYDRSKTTMSDFKMCQDCLQDYNDPLSRRFHAQTLCCHKCGPQLNLSLDRARAMIAEGKIGLIKGLTGFHLIGNAESKAVIQKIRMLKERSEKALAVMIKDDAEFDPHLRHQLKSSIGPLIITDKIKLSTQSLLAPHLKTLAVMLPPTPLHYLLFGKLNALIATSGNPKNYPLIKQINDLPLEWLNQIDFILDHNRVIQHCVDDSIIQDQQVLRRGRGLSPLITFHQSSRNVIAWGSDMKIAPIIQTPFQRIQMPYLGELSHPKNGEKIKKEIEDIKKLIKIDNLHELIDAHPQTLTRALTNSQDRTSIYHHHAHAESAYQEFKTSLVFTFDGTGYGEDHQHWGGELLNRSLNGQWMRMLSFEPIPFFAGDHMIKFPAYALAALKYQMGLYQGPLKPYIEKSPLKTTSAGRWFDALAAELFFQDKEITYEAQAAIEMEHLSLAPTDKLNWNEFLFEGEFPTLTLAKYILYEFKNRFNLNERAWLAHDGLAYLMARAVKHREENDIGASGGVWQNQLLRSRCEHHFAQINKFLHFSSPCNDESIALGQLGVFECMN